MNTPILITEGNGRRYFSLDRLSAGIPVGGFQCRIPEYTDYLREDALRAQKDHVAITWLLLERETIGIAAYMLLIADAVRLSDAEADLYC